MDLKNIILILVLLANIFLAYLSYFRSRKTKVNLVWSIVIGTIVLWIASMIFYRAASPADTIFWSRILYIAAAIIPLVLLYFTFLFPKEKLEISKVTQFFVILFTASIIFLVAFTNIILKGVVIGSGQEKVIIWGFGYFAYAFYISSYFTWSIWNLFRKYLKSFGVLKSQLRYMLLGIGISVLLGTAFNLFMPWFGDFRFNWLGQITTLFLVGSVSYAISRYRLMDIRVVFTEFLVILTAFVLLVEVMLSETFYRGLFRTGIFLVFIFFGYLLIRSVLDEIKRREELENLTTKLKKAYEELQRLDKAKSEFVSIASHQLRTPLTAIKGYISMMLENTYGKLPKTIQGPLQNVYTSNERLIKLVNDLLSVSRIEAGRLEMNYRKTSLEDVILSVMKELEIEAKGKKIYLKWRKPLKSIPKILMDPEKIRQVILNIIDNAIRYTNHGGVTVSIKNLKSKIQIIISDTGDGMIKGEISHLFESFSRGKAGARFWTEGAGLGLYVAKKFVEMHDGEIWAKSPGKGKGSTFYIELPIK